MHVIIPESKRLHSPALLLSNNDAMNDTATFVCIVRYSFQYRRGE